MKTIRHKGKDIFFIAVYVTLVASFLFLCWKYIEAPATLENNIVGVRVKSDYTLMITQCLLGIVAMHMPRWMEEHWHLKFPRTMLFLYVLFLYCAIYLGEVRSFYYQVPHWDTILHTFSGGMIAAIGFSVLCLMNNANRIPLNLSPVFVAFFAFCFALTIGVVWEIYEFSFDGLLGLNMQKFALEDGTLLAGRAALADTMKDLIVDAIGACVVSLIGYLSLKYKTGWLEQIFISRKKRQDQQTAMDQKEG